MGTPLELQTLVQRSALKPDSVGTLVLAWADDIVQAGVEPGSPDALAGADALAAMEALFAELPRESARILIARRMTNELEQLADRYLWRARRFDQGATNDPVLPTTHPASEDLVATAQVRYLTVSSAARAIALQRLLDEIDPPSAVVLTRSAESQAVATRSIEQLGYRLPEDPIRVTQGEVPEGIHTVVFFDVPVRADELARAGSAGAVNVIVLVTPREIGQLRDIAGAVAPLTLRGPGSVARNKDRLLRDELATILVHGIASRELLALEPLLDHYDGIEIAAAAVRLLERERQKAQTVAEAARQTSPRRDREERPDRSGDRRFDRESKGFRGGEQRFERENRGGRSGEGRFGGDKKFGGERKFGRGERKFGGSDRKSGTSDRKFGGNDRKFGGERKPSRGPR